MNTAELYNNLINYYARTKDILNQLQEVIETRYTLEELLELKHQVDIDKVEYGAEEILSAWGNFLDTYSKHHKYGGFYVS